MPSLQAFSQCEKEIKEKVKKLLQYWGGGECYDENIKIQVREVCIPRGADA